jgi:hypothetical protein
MSLKGQYHERTEWGTTSWLRKKKKIQANFSACKDNTLNYEKRHGKSPFPKVSKSCSYPKK